jgi:hypothetical protein
MISVGILVVSSHATAKTLIFNDKPPYLAVFSSILADPIPPFPPQLITILIQHLTQPFHGSLIDAEDYWKTQAVQYLI